MTLSTLVIGATRTVGPFDPPPVPYHHLAETAMFERNRVLAAEARENAEVAAREAALAMERERIRHEEEHRREAEEAERRREAEAAARASAAAPTVAGGSVWDRLAQCESHGNWAINTGNGYYGGLQFNLQTWQAYGGTGYPHQHSRETQIAVAEKLRAARGFQPWPACSRKLGLR